MLEIPQRARPAAMIDWACGMYILSMFGLFGVDFEESQFSE